ncbi:MAG: GIY-YIG nuclease family protein [Candidatus Liptonbacteria bacterium]|nr:GIY-YIG nuclease family protein [Candidatus Liptonbacteria bacterium]
MLFQNKFEKIPPTDYNISYKTLRCKKTRAYSIAVERPDGHREGRSRTHMYSVYILQSDKNGRYYIGSTNDVERRLAEHNAGKTKSLRFILPVRIVFTKEFESLKDARRAEIKLKKFKNRNIIERIISEKTITGL